MNYSSECAQQCYSFAERLAKDKKLSDAQALLLLTAKLEESRKFIFPPPYKLNINADADSLKLMKLPYPVCAFEFSFPQEDHENLTEDAMSRTAHSKRIALAFDCSKNDFPIDQLKKIGRLQKDYNGMLVFSFIYSNATKKWTPFPVAGYIDENIAKLRNDFSLDNNKTKIAFEPIYFLNDLTAKFLGEETLQDAFQKNPLALVETMAYIKEEVSLAVRATLMLNTKNLRVVKAVKAPKELNYKRRKQNKVPYFDYYTLDIFFSDTGKLVDRKKVDYGFIKQQINSQTLMKRWGTVRGHFKKRSTGIFWWNDHARGNKLNGIIEKDYEVKPEKKFKP